MPLTIAFITFEYNVLNYFYCLALPPTQGKLREGSDVVCFIHCCIPVPRA